MNRDVPARAHNSALQRRWDGSTAPSAMTNNNQVPAVASPDSRNVSDDRIQPPRSHRRHPDFETTADGDVVIVQPSFDDDGHGNSAQSSQSAWQCQQTDGKQSDLESKQQGDALKEPVKRHTRNLSAHFFDATSLSRKDSTDSADAFRDEDPHDTRKHRRMTSGGVSNPNTAHRRLNSIGNSAPVRRLPTHHRELSAGLDILSAAANATSEELEQAAGTNWQQKPQQQQAPQHGPSNPPPPEAPLHGPAMQQGYRSFPPPSGHVMPPPPHQMRRFSGPGPTAQQHYPPNMYNTPAYSSYPTYYPYSRPEYQPDQYPSQHSMYPPTKMYPPESRTAAPTSDPNAARSWAEQPQRATQGSQTFVTTMAVGGNKTMRPTGNEGVPSHVTQHHHRRMSSFSSLGLGTIFGAGGSTSPERNHPLKNKSDAASHHRSTSSSVSFLNALDVAGMAGAMDETFIRSLHEPSASATTETTSAATPSVCVPITSEVKSSNSTDEDSPKKLAPGNATSKRVRRKCTISGCPNRVVQGGLCISHGAKRKTCKHPGCNKNVKKAGLCSTHGPARKRCDVANCQKVAVQGGRCIAHGAKKKLCEVENCTKQAILSGMCKKHHDQTKEGKESKVKTHQRGLSIFAEISADTVQTIINADTVTEGSSEKDSKRRSW